VASVGFAGAENGYLPVPRRRAAPERGPLKYAQLSPRKAVIESTPKASSDMSDVRIPSRMIPIQASPINAKTIPEMRLSARSKRFKKWSNFADKFALSNFSILGQRKYPGTPVSDSIRFQNAPLTRIVSRNDASDSNYSAFFADAREGDSHVSGVDYKKPDRLAPPNDGFLANRQH
jgi:hypothetical protein